MPNSEYMRLGDLPDDLTDILMREFVPYSVGVARVSESNPRKFQPLGSGTLVRKNDRFGVLTAQHCLAACSPRVRVGPDGTDSLLLVLRDGRGVQLPAADLWAHELGVPAAQEYGPDLAFLEIAPTQRLQTIRSIGSVWSLDRDAQKILTSFGSVGSTIAALGVLEERSSTHAKRRAFHRISYHLTCLHVIAERSVTCRGDWDYIDNRCEYMANSLPSSFAGFSGGGIWSLEIKRSKATGELSVGKAALVGVSFYETAIEDGTRFVRGHFVHSIYDTAWRDF
jgi:hypothetical protein